MGRVCKIHSVERPEVAVAGATPALTQDSTDGNHSNIGEASGRSVTARSRSGPAWAREAAATAPSCAGFSGHFGDLDSSAPSPKRKALRRSLARAGICAPDSGAQAALPRSTGTSGPGMGSGRLPASRRAAAHSASNASSRRSKRPSTRAAQHSPGCRVDGRSGSAFCYRELEFTPAHEQEFFDGSIKQRQAQLFGGLQGPCG